MTDDVKVHVHPAWRDKADFMLNMKIDSEDGKLRHEQLWVKRHDDERFEICCIPFFLYDMALGDTVLVTVQDGRPLMHGVVEESGHHTFRAWFGEGGNPAAKDEVVAHLEQLGCLYEWFSAQLLAIDAANDELAVTVANYLLAQEENGQLQYETGRTE